MMVTMKKKELKMPVLSDFDKAALERSLARSKPYVVAKDFRSDNLPPQKKGTTMNEPFT